MKEGLIQLNLELTDLMAECGLGDRQKRRRLGEAPEVRHLNEVLKLPQIHLPSESCNGGWWRYLSLR
jgi:hypothetical protein